MLQIIDRTFYPIHDAWPNQCAQQAASSLKNEFVRFFESEIALLFQSTDLTGLIDQIEMHS